MAGLRSLREGRSPAESRPGTCRLVRPGAACESRTEAHRYRGFQVRAFGRECGWYRGRHGLSSPIVGMEVIFYERI